MMRDKIIMILKKIIMDEEVFEHYYRQQKILKTNAVKK